MTSPAPYREETSNLWRETTQKIKERTGWNTSEWESKERSSMAVKSWVSDRRAE